MVVRGDLGGSRVILRCGDLLVISGDLQVISGDPLRVVVILCGQMWSSVISGDLQVMSGDPL